MKIPVFDTFHSIFLEYMTMKLAYSQISMRSRTRNVHIFWGNIADYLDLLAQQNFDQNLKFVYVHNPFVESLNGIKNNITMIFSCGELLKKWWMK